ncbi:hypothetical protein [Photobacterium leiognathi]|uniref:Uncharacterized protein n=2 Tax=Photobacterium leiognathi TaxID=553611 RepID=X0P7W0_PHOLE|nr:hypothetical protein [Photobacterium leiognathi]KJF95597.1 hypothetical protein UB34_17935 [Photobacterium leiognathi]PSV92638.1 hypothetical protein CTM89_03010 [Photobacterium leiognathi]PSW54730.1 hypothetical protein C0W50_17905 [Photobacterium leiognathi subsp. mandapamensis]PSW65517.1 hypothetical protein C0W88_10665 [Photobacterium leiognathi subsp. mandapamensis]GAD29233.1 conserved hypothetical protein [Photobacterium leiognathi lrivu.4.1]
MEDKSILGHLTVKERLALAEQGKYIELLINDPDRRVREVASEHDLDILIDDDAATEDLLSFL